MTSFVLIDRMSNQNQQESGEACAALTIMHKAGEDQARAETMASELEAIGSKTPGS